MTVGLCYQSGESVSMGGLYEVVGVHLELVADEDRDETDGRESNIRTLQVGQCFPDYEGRAVCWYLIKPAAKEVSAETASVGNQS